jgi:periplasmic divalent cation tolerance protein
MSELRIVLSSIEDKKTGLGLAHQLVDEGLVACVNLVPGCTSVYKWKDKVEEEGETLMVMKTTKSRLRELEKRFHALHPYELPEFVVFESAQASRDYMAWVMEQVGD